MPSRPSDRRGFDVAIICSLTLEADCVQAIFDRFWADDGLDYGKAPGDTNAYTTGAIGQHNVVLAYSPRIGVISSAIAASSLRLSFPNIRLLLLTGICGGVPYTASGEEIFLGDVIISTSVVQYDFGRQGPAFTQRQDTSEERTGHLNPEIKATVAKMQTRRYRHRLRDRIATSLARLEQDLGITYPGTVADKLWHSSHTHKHYEPADCAICTGNEQVCSEARQATCERLRCSATGLARDRSQSERGQAPAPEIHFGLVAYGDTVMRSAEMRDKMSQRDGVLGFDLSSISAYDHFPSIIIKGVCDYADGHKTKVFQPYAAATAAAFVKAFLEEFHTLNNWREEQVLAGRHETRVAKTTAFTSASCAYWVAPFRNPNFVGRNYEINRVERKLTRRSSVQTLALVGLGGIGKTSLALELVCRQRDQDAAISVFWANARNENLFERDMLVIGQKLGILDSYGKALKSLPSSQYIYTDVTALVCEHLSRESTGRWMFVLDGADDESLWTTSVTSRRSYIKYLPRSTKGSLIVTSRSRQVASQLAASEVIEIREMEKDKSQSLLLSLLINSEVRDNERAIEEVLEKLAYLPLAIAQAAAYINMKGITIRDYAQLLSETGDDEIPLVLSEVYEDATFQLGASKSVTDIWTLTFEQIRRSNTSAMEYLCFMSCLGKEQFPHYLLPNLSSKKHEVEAIGMLAGFGLINHHTDGLTDDRLYDMHRLVQLAGRKWLRDRGSLQQWMTKVLIRLDQCFTLPSPDTQQSDYILIPHARAVISWRGADDHDARYTLASKVAEYFLLKGQYQEAVDMCFSNVLLREAKQGSSHVATLSAYSQLAEACQLNGELDRAHALAEPAFHGLTEQLGRQDPQTLSSMVVLASLAFDRGHWDEAEILASEALQIIMSAPQQDRERKRAIIMNNLALIYQHRGKWMQAETLAVEVQDVMCDLVGVDHPDTTVSLDTLASIYHCQGKWMEAEQLVVQALRSKDKILGHEHPITLTSMDRLARIYQCLGRYDDAQRLAQEATQLWIKCLGPTHPSALDSLETLSILHASQERWHEAARLTHDILQNRTKVLGQEHPDTLVSMNDLALVEEALGKPLDAISLCKQAFEMAFKREKVLGPEHPITIKAMRDLGMMLWKYDRPEQGETMCIEAMGLYRKVFGSTHPYTLQTMSQVCNSWMNQRDYQKAAELLLRCLPQQTSTLPDGHPDLLISSHMLGRLLDQNLVHWTPIIDQLKLGGHLESLWTYTATSGLKKLASLLLNNTARDMDEKSIYGKALSLAVIHNHEVIVRQLLGAGADLSFVSEDTKSVLHLASEAGHDDMVRLLIQHGADLSVIGSYGTALHGACINGHASVAAILIDNGADVNVQCERYGGPIHAACIGQHESVVTLLLRKGADSTAVSLTCGTPLDIVKVNGNQKVMRLLVDWISSLSDDNYDSGYGSGYAESSIASSSVEDSIFSGRSSRASSVSTAMSFETNAPEQVYTLLLTEVLLHPILRQLSGQIFVKKGEDRLIHAFATGIRRFCKGLRTESSSPLQQGATQVLYRRRFYFAERVAYHLTRSTLQDGQPITPMPVEPLDVVARVEGFLKTRQNPPVEPQVASSSTLSSSDTQMKPVSLRKTIETVSKESELIGDGETAPPTNTGGTNEGSESSEDDYSDSGEDTALPSLTKETISWLVESIAFRNLIFDLTLEIFPPMDYVTEALQYALPATSTLTVSVDLQSTIVEYARTQLSRPEELSTVLTLSGDPKDAEAAACIEYCQRLWPKDGSAVVQTLQSAIASGECSCDLPSGTSLSIRLNTQSKGINSSIHVSLTGKKDDVIKTVQQFAWFCVIFQVPKDGFLSSSRFTMRQSASSGHFEFLPLKLKHIASTSQACWHPLFENWVLAHGFPIRPRHHEIGLELPFAAMVQLSEILGPVSYKGGVVLKGLSSILYLVSPPKVEDDFEDTSSQWHLIQLKDRVFANLKLLDKKDNRYLCPPAELNSLPRLRTFLGCYTKVKIQLATQDCPYDSIRRSSVQSYKGGYQFTGGSAAIALPNFMGFGPTVTASGTFSLPKQTAVKLTKGPYEQYLVQLSKMPVILYDTDDRRAWMVPVLSVIFHMVHIWYHESARAMTISKPPYVEAVSDIGLATLKVLQQNSELELYKDNQKKPFKLQSQVERYMLNFEALRGESEAGSKSLVGWDLMDIVREKCGLPQIPAHTDFAGNWSTLTKDENMVIIFGRGLGNVITPDGQKVCTPWRFVPPKRDYLTVGMHCLREIEHLFPQSEDGSTHSETSDAEEVRKAFDDCSHDKGQLCHRAQKLWSCAAIHEIRSQVGEEGAVVFGDELRARKVAFKNTRILEERLFCRT